LSELIFKLNKLATIFKKDDLDVITDYDENGYFNLEDVEINGMVYLVCTEPKNDT